VKTELMLDSGAFSAWTQGHQIDLNAYAEFCLAHQKHLWMVVNLDVIPGRPGDPPTQEEVEDSAKRSWANYRKLHKAGVSSMPVYHHGERRYWLEKIVNEGNGLLGLGGIANKSPQVREAWLDEVFGYLCRGHDYPTIKVHGFGMTSVPLIHKYPWFSVDSVTWTRMAAYGWLLMPRSKTAAGYNWFDSFYMIGMTDSEELRDIDSGVFTDHYLAMGTHKKQYVDGYLDHEGFDPKQLSTDAAARLQANVRFFRRVAEAWRIPIFKQRTTDLFHIPQKDRPPRRPIYRTDKLAFVFGTTLSAKTNLILNEEEIEYRLVSFYPLRNSPGIDIARFVRTGKPILKKKEVK
jgi:hypothetical protein